MVKIETLYNGVNVYGLSTLGERCYNIHGKGYKPKNMGGVYIKLYIGIALCLCAVNLSQKPDNVPLDGFYKLMYLAYILVYIVNLFFLFRYNDIITSFVCAVCSLASVMISNDIPNQITGAFNVLLFLMSVTMFVYNFWF